MNIGYFGKKTILSQYFGDVDYIDVDIFERSTWSQVDDLDKIFMYIPKKARTVEQTKEFLLYCADQGVDHIVKLGSLGPYRMIHQQIDSFANEAGLYITTLAIAPLMNAIFYEQYCNKVLYDYRYGGSAPYLDPEALAHVIHYTLHSNYVWKTPLHITGDEQYTIYDIALHMEDCGYDVESITDRVYTQTHDIDSRDADEMLLARLGEKYMHGWFPETSDTVKTLFYYSGRSFAQFLADDKDKIAMRFEEDKWL